MNSAVIGQSNGTPAYLATPRNRNVSGIGIAQWLAQCAYPCNGGCLSSTGAKGPQPDQEEFNRVRRLLPPSHHDAQLTETAVIASAIRAGGSMTHAAHLFDRSG